MTFAWSEPVLETETDEGPASVFSPLIALPRVKATAKADPVLVKSEPAEPSPEQLAEQSQGGCRESFEHLVRRYESQVFNFLRQLTSNRHDAEDLTQETFVKAYRGLHGYKPSLSFAPWLFSIARRTAASHFRSADRFEELPEEGEVVEENPAGLLASKDESNSLWRLARRLNPKQWEALWLRYGEGFSVGETARVMQTNSIHVKVLLHRARGSLAKMLAAREARELSQGPGPADSGK